MTTGIPIAGVGEATLGGNDTGAMMDDIPGGMKGTVAGIQSMRAGPDSMRAGTEDTSHGMEALTHTGGTMTRGGRMAGIEAAHRKRAVTNREEV